MNNLQTANKRQISQTNCSLQIVRLFTLTEMCVIKKPTVLNKLFTLAIVKTVCEEQDNRV